MGIKKFISVIFLGVLLAKVAIAGSVSSDKIVAIVNSDIITQSELDKQISLIKRGGQNKLKLAGLRKHALDDLIDKSLQLQLAERNKIEIGDKELDSIVSSIAKNNGLSIDQLKKQLLSQEGITLREFRNQLREQGMISRAQQQFLGRDITVSDGEINKFLRSQPAAVAGQAQYHVMDILVQADDANQDKKKSAAKIADELVRKIKNVSDVEKVAEDFEKRYKAQKILVKDLGWRRIPDFPDLFVSKIGKMKQGEVAGPIEAPNGLHVLKVLAIHNQAKLSKERAREAVYHQKLMKKLKPWLKNQRSKAYIKIIK